MPPDIVGTLTMGEPQLQIDSKRSSFVICSECEGSGEVVEPFHHVPSGIEPKKEPCNRCGGTGRLKKTVAIHYERL